MISHKRVTVLCFVVVTVILFVHGVFFLAVWSEIQTINQRLADIEKAAQVMEAAVVTHLRQDPPPGQKIAE